MRSQENSDQSHVLKRFHIRFSVFHAICKTPTVGFEPTTFGLEVQRASPLRHAGLRISAKYMKAESQT